MQNTNWAKRVGVVLTIAAGVTLIAYNYVNRQRGNISIAHTEELIEIRAQVVKINESQLPSGPSAKDQLHDLARQELDSTHRMYHAQERWAIWQTTIVSTSYLVVMCCGVILVNKFRTRQAPATQS